MREILFKAKRLDNGEWVCGSFVGDGIDDFSIYSYSESDGDISGWSVYEVDPKTLCQFTGVKDKNGNKIFEGDIVEHERDVCRDIGPYYSDDFDTEEATVKRVCEIRISIDGIIGKGTLESINTDGFKQKNDKWRGRLRRLSDFATVVGNIHDK